MRRIVLNTNPQPLRNEQLRTIVIVTDSEHVTKVLSKSVWEWERNGWVDANGHEVVYKPEVEMIHTMVKSYERSGVAVKFWTVNEEGNKNALLLAERAIVAMEKERIEVEKKNNETERGNMKMVKKELETETERIEIEKKKLDMEKEKLEMEKGELETEREMVEVEKKKLETAKENIEMKRKKIEMEKGTIGTVMKAFGRRESPEK
jgi:hypothetical protein